MPRRKGGGEIAVSKTSMEPEKAMLENNHPVGMKTPVPITKKPVTSTFPGRLEWKMSRLGMPTTSTPKLDLFSNSRAVTRRDVDTAFGFDDSSPEFEGNYSALISPIAHPHIASPNNVVPVWKINPLTQRNVECELPKRITASANDETPGRRSQRIRKLTNGSGHAISDIKDSKKSVKFTDVESKSGQTNVKNLTNDKTDSIHVIENLQVPEALVKSFTTTESKKSRSTRARNRRVILEPVDEIHKPEEEFKTTEVVLQIEEKETLESQTSQNARTKKPAVKLTTKRLNKKVVPEPEAETKTTEVVFHIEEKETLESQKSRSAKKVTVAKAKTKKPAVKLTTKRLNKRTVPEPEAETKTTRTSRTVRTSSKKLAIGTSSSNVPIKVTKIPQIFDFPDDEQDGLSPFSQLLDRYNEDEPKPMDGELHVDPKRILRTYSSRKRIKAFRDREIESDDDDEEAVACIPVPVETKKKRRGNSRQISSKKIKKQNEELDEETSKWLDEKNKEFEDVLKVPLVIENSYSESE